MTDGSDRYEILIPLDNNLDAYESLSASDDFNSSGDSAVADALGPLNEGDQAEITITTEVGAQTVAFIQVPDSLSAEAEGDVVTL
ncbi:hypothetical protein [Halovenus salina]|uniref:TRAM domain-containing protein n=2 Tax=Halovenus salina TaxID=1510225 RepID=A0ABD5W1M3_9EURY